MGKPGVGQGEALLWEKETQSMRSFILSVSLGVLVLGLLGVVTPEAQAQRFRRRAAFVPVDQYYVLPAQVVGTTPVLTTAPGVITSYYTGPAQVVTPAATAVATQAPAEVVTRASTEVVTPAPAPVVRTRTRGIFGRRRAVVMGP
jgi:hypothetical protein